MNNFHGLVIRNFGGRYCVCDGKEKNPDIYGIGQRFSPWFDHQAEAEDWRRRLYGVISKELHNASVKFNNDAYEIAAVFLEEKHDI